MHKLTNFMSPVVSIFLIKYFGYHDILASKSIPSDMAAILMNHLPQSMLFLTYGVAILGIIIASITLIIININKFKCHPREITIPKEKRVLEIIIF